MKMYKCVDNTVLYSIIYYIEGVQLGFFTKDKFINFPVH